MTEKTTAKTAYIVIVGDENAISTLALEVDGLDGITLQRKATNFDIYQSVKEIASDIEQQMLAARVSESVLASISAAIQASQVSPEQQKTEEFTQRVQQKLNERMSESEGA